VDSLDMLEIEHEFEHDGMKHDAQESAPARHCSDLLSALWPVNIKLPQGTARVVMNLAMNDYPARGR
jgi:hypothetical protein